MADSTASVDWHQRLSELFEANIKGRWVPRISEHDHARGDTFERLLGKERDNASLPDFGDIEIKSSKGNAMISLFTKSPSQRDALRAKYGTDEVHNEVPYKKLYATFNTKDFTESKTNIYDFKVVADRLERKLKVVVRDKTGAIVSDGEVYWNFDELENSVVKKLSRVAVVNYSTDAADSSVIRYNDFELIEGFTFEQFLQSVDDGALTIDLRLGQFHSGPNEGLLHDHGTAFRMSPANFRKYGGGQAAAVARNSYTPHATVAKTSVATARLAARVAKKMAVAATKPSPATVAARLHKKAEQFSRGTMCVGCGRPLSNPKSVARGYGPGCAPATA